MICHKCQGYGVNTVTYTSIDFLKDMFDPELRFSNKYYCECLMGESIGSIMIITITLLTGKMGLGNG